MPESQLEKVMVGLHRASLRHSAGDNNHRERLDIPNANTIFIDQADHYGLA